MQAIPKILYKNKISEILDEMRYNYGVLTRSGYIYGLIAVDQDAKIIAVDSRFDSKLNYWDLASIGAALYGVAKQGQDFFEAEDLQRGALIYNNMQLFVKSIGQVALGDKGKRDILIVVLSDKKVNVGIAVLQMNRFAGKIKDFIKLNGDIKNTLKMNEQELKEHIKGLKKQLFADKIGLIS